MVVVGLTSVLHISNIARVIVSHVVGDGLGSAIGQQNVVVTVGSVPITGLLLAVMKTGIVILDSVTVLVMGGSFMVRRGGVSIGGGVVDRGMVDRGMVDRGMVDRSVVDGGVVDGGVGDGGMVGDGVIGHGHSSQGKDNEYLHVASVNV